MLHFVSFLANKKQKIAPNKYKHRFTMLRPTSIIDKQQEDIFTKLLGPALGNTETARKVVGALLMLASSMAFLT